MLQQFGCGLQVALVLIGRELDHPPRLVEIATRDRDRRAQVEQIEHRAASGLPRLLCPDLVKVVRQELPAVARDRGSRDRDAGGLDHDDLLGTTFAPSAASGGSGETAADSSCSSGARRAFARGARGAEVCHTVVGARN